MVMAWLWLHASDLMATSLNHRLNQYIEQALRQFSVPTVSVVVVDQDQVLYANTFGQTRQGVRPVYYIGSISKSLTALAVLRLVDSGQLALDHEILQYLPELAIENAGGQITVRHLLNHSSGLNRLDGFMDLERLESVSDHQTEIRLHSKPGEKYEYSNLNYVILGMLIERISGMSYSDFLAELVFEPLAMNNSSVDCSHQGDLLPHHQYWGWPQVTAQMDYHRLSIPAGFLCSTAFDLGQFLMLNLNQGSIEEQQLVSESMIKTMHSVWNDQQNGYAMGWRRGQFNGEPMLQHLGSTATSVSGVFMFPEKSLGVVVLSNSNSLWFTESLMVGVLDLLTRNEPSPVSGFERYFRWAILAALVLVLLHWLYQLFKTYRNRANLKRRACIKKLVMQLLLIMSIVLAFPYVAGIPFMALISFQPDIGTLMLCSLMAHLLLAVWQLIISNKSSGQA